MSLFFSNCIYVAARLARRCLPTTVPSGLRRLLPFLDGNFGASNGAGVVGLYSHHLGGRRPGWPGGLTVLEVGVGATNGSCYELAALGARRVIALEPYVALAVERDAAQLRATVRAGVGAEQLAERVGRIGEAASLETGSVAGVLSHSVLEHGAEPERLARELARVLAPGGFMLHVVDYRDHFFRYPYHFLQWSRTTWNRWLNHQPIECNSYPHYKQTSPIHQAWFSGTGITHGSWCPPGSLGVGRIGRPRKRKKTC